MTPARHDWSRLVRWALDYGRPYWIHFLALLGLSLAASGFTLLTPLPLKIVVDSVLGSQSLPWFAVTSGGAPGDRRAALVVAIGLLVVLAILSHLQSLASWLLQTYLGERLVLALRADLFRHVQRLSVTYHDAQGSTDSTYRIQYDATAIQSIAIHGLVPIATAGLTLMGMVGVLARIEPQFALLALLVAPVLLLLLRASAPRLRTLWTEVKEIESSAMSLVQEVLAAVRVVKAFGREDHEHRRFLQRARQGLRGQLKIAAIEGTLDLLVGGTLAAGVAVALFIGARHVQAGRLSTGDLLVVLAYLSQLYGPLETIAKRIAQLQAALVGAERVLRLLDQPADVVERPHARLVERAAGAVSFRHVTYAYPGTPPVLKAVCLDAPPGTRVGIMGVTGAGKTTLISLLTRFFDPTSGAILLDDVDLRDYRVDDLRRQFALVLQEPVLFATTIAENIAYARPDARRQDIVDAARAARAHDFIERLPEGYETNVGERGLRLSGGERQRISLARAFLKDAPIVVLDEPTSAVDLQTEIGILDAMAQLTRGRTTFLITHRPSALAICDVALELADGHLVPYAPLRAAPLSAP